MDTLFERYYSKLNATSMDFVRPAIHWLEQDVRLIGIKGPRGVGKTTLLLQYLKSKPELLKQSLYVSLDNIWFANNSLYDLADKFSKKGGSYSHWMRCISMLIGRRS